jgi:lipopolysaccharide transport protein LptA
MIGFRSAATILALPLLLGGSARADDVGANASRLGLDVSLDAPTAIRSQELEASRDDAGRERVIFEGSVVVEQADLRIFCDWLEATYPTEGEGGPERLVARGKVRIRQGESEVECTEAVFESKRQRAVCTSSDGPAILRRGDDIVEGREIVFDLARSTLRVSGGAIVRVQPKKDPEP